jgi:hypothetical protein
MVADHSPKRAWGSTEIVKLAAIHCGGFPTCLSRRRSQHLVPNLRHSCSSVLLSSGEMDRLQGKPQEDAVQNASPCYHRQDNGTPWTHVPIPLPRSQHRLAQLSLMRLRTRHGAAVADFVHCARMIDLSKGPPRKGLAHGGSRSPNRAEMSSISTA